MYNKEPQKLLRRQGKLLQKHEAMSSNSKNPQKKKSSMASCILAAPSLWMRGARRVIHIFWPSMYLTVQFGTLYHWNKGEGNQIGLVISFFGLYNQVKL